MTKEVSRLIPAQLKAPDSTKPRVVIGFPMTVYQFVRSNLKNTTYKQLITFFLTISIPHAHGK